MELLYYFAEDNEYLHCKNVQRAHKCENKFSVEPLWEMAIFLHYFHSAGPQVIDIRLEIKANKKITKCRYSQTPINGVKIYFTIKTTVS